MNCGKADLFESHNTQHRIFSGTIDLVYAQPQGDTFACNA